MEKNEMIEILMEKADISHEEAKEVLEKCNWDLYESVSYLEKIGKIKNKETTTIIEVKQEDQKKNKEKKNHEETFGGIGEIVGRIFKFIGKFVKKGNENFFEVRKENEKTIRISLTISAILLVFLFVPSIVLLIIGLFCGYKYSIAGSNIKCDGVNSVFEEVSKSADNIKKDFKEGYES